MHFLNLRDFTSTDFLRVFTKADAIKKNRKYFGSLLEGKTIGLLFEKPSLRTRVSFEVGLNNLAAHPLYLSQGEVQLGHRESIADVARILSGYIDGIIIRTFSHHIIEEFAKHALIPVINGLTDRYHPAQVLSDYYTISRKKGQGEGKIENLKIVYVGDVNNVCHSLIIGATKFGNQLVVACPEEHMSKSEILEMAIVETDPVRALRDADVVYTDVWTSMGDEREQKERKSIFSAFQINTELLRHAKPDVLVMHCLPAHRGEEITEEIMEHKKAIVFEQAQNRLFVQQALMTEVFGNE